MSDADTAYAVAERLIAEAKRGGAISLDFNRPETHALTALPPAIAELADLRSLDLGNTKVTDLTPIAGMTAMTVLSLINTEVTDLASIAGMTAMTVLDLNGTEVTDLTPIAGMTAMTGLFLSGFKVTDLIPIAGMTAMTTLTLDDIAAVDLRPIRGLKRLVAAPYRSGLTFKDSGAARQDPRIAEIAKIEDKAERARALFDYLEDWVPPGEGDGNAPEQDRFLPVQIVDGKLEIAASLPTEAEVDERLKQVLHQRLKLRGQDLARQAGNEFIVVAAKARSLSARLDANFADLDMLNIHLDIGELKRLAERGRERPNEPEFPSDLRDAIADVTEDGPGLTLDHPDVELLETRKRRSIAGSEANEADHNQMATALAADKAAIGERLGALEARTLDRDSGEDGRAVQITLHRNVLIKIGRLIRAAPGALIGAVVVDFAKAPIVDLLTMQWPIFAEIALSYGTAFFDWFAGAVSSVPDLPTSLRRAMDMTKRKSPK